MKSFPVKTLLIGLLMVAGCKKDKGNDPVIKIEGFDIYDQVGMPMGHIGPGDNDWKCINYLTPQELALFDFMPNDVNLNNTVEASITENRIFPFPNPISTRQYYLINVSDSVVLKIVVVNNKLDVLGKTALKIKGSSTIGMEYTDRNVFKNQAAFRFYFSFSAANKPNFKAGYGDIKICEGVDNCF